MKRSLAVALAALLLCLSSTRADYILVVVDLNKKSDEEGNQNGGQVGGMAGGVPQPGGMIGGPPRPGGMIGGPPQPGGMGGNIGGPPRPGGMMAGGNIGGPPRPGGNIGGPPRPGGIMMGGMPQPGGGDSSTQDIDDSPDLVFAILEVSHLGKQKAALLAKGMPVSVMHRWGTKQMELYPKADIWDMRLLEKTPGVSVPTPAERFKSKSDEVLKDKPTTKDVVNKLALFALEMGLVDKCAEVMAKLAETDKNDPAVAAFLKVKEQLDEKLGKDDRARAWKEKLFKDGDTYEVTQTDTHHFALIHSASVKDVKSQLDQLEKSYRAFYYWWALRAVTLPVPKERQVALMTEKPEDSAKLRSNLTASPMLVESFHARREGLAIFAGQRSDAPFLKVETTSKQFWDEDFKRLDLLSGEANKGIPKKFRALDQNSRIAVHKARHYALILKLLEHEWEQTGISHEVSRQGLFASKLLPRNVNAPEWIQFGMGSFFETSQQSPWPSIGAPNPYYLPRFKELHKQGKYEKSPLDTMKKVVTDAYFREKPTGSTDAEKAHSREVNLRKARAAAWSLTFYLARSETHLPRLQKYFKELSKQPRDVELDEKVLWACFQKAFAGENLDQLARRWLDNVNAQSVEAESIHAKIREMHKTVSSPKTGGGIGGGRPTNPGGTGGGAPPPINPGGPRR